MIKRSFIVLAVIVLVSGCIDYKSYLKTDIDINFSVDLPVDISVPLMKTGPFAFDVAETFNPVGAPELAQFLDNIQAVTVTGITATVTALSESIVLTDVVLTCTHGEDSVSWSIDEVSVDEGSTLGLTNDNDELTTLSAMLATMENIDFTFTGYSDTNNVQYTLRVDMATTVTAGL